MAAGRVVVGLAAVPLADVLVDVALELSAKRATVIGTAGRHDVLQRYGLGGGGGRAGSGARRLAGNSAVMLVAVVVDHHQGARVRPVVVPAV